MTCRAFGIAVGALLCFIAAPVSAQQSTTKTIAKQNSKLVLDMPGLNGGREVFQYFGWDSTQKIERSYAAQMPSAGSYPRAQVYLYVLRLGYVWAHEKTVDESVIKGSIPFLRDRAITIETADQGGQNQNLAHVRTRFSVDGAKCIWFKAVEGRMGAGMGGASPGGNYSVSGFYCGPVGQPLSASDIRAVLDGWRYVPNPPGSGVAMAPASPPSAPAESAPAPVLAPPAPSAFRSAPRSKLESSGSGFVVSRDGHVLTNAHVIERCAAVRAKLPGGKAAEVEVIARDQRGDLALLKAEFAPSAVASFRDGTRVRPGEAVVAVGFPLHGLLASEANVSPGAVSAVSGLRDDARHLQITAPVQSGNSGGPLLDASGNVVGIVFSKLNALKVAGITGDIPQNGNFAIKAELATGFMLANGVVADTSASTVERKPADIGDEAKRFTLLIECWK